MAKIPFSMEAYEGFGSVKGLVSLETSDLLLEFETSDAILGLIKSGPKEMRLPLADLRSLSLEEGWLSTSLRIEANSLAALAGFPERNHGKIRLSLARSDRPEAESLLEQAYALGLSR